MEELKRFLTSINFEYTDKLAKTTIEKVVLKKDTLTYNVYLRSENVLSYDLVVSLFNAAKRGINGKNKCYIELIYDIHVFLLSDTSGIFTSEKEIS